MKNKNKRKRMQEAFIRTLYLKLGYALLSYEYDKLKSVVENKEPMTQEDYEKAHMETNELLNDIVITNIGYKKHLFKANEIIITAVRPGLLIGKAGRVINKVKEEFKDDSDKRITHAKIVIKEDKFHDSLFTFMFGLEY